MNFFSLVRLKEKTFFQQEKKEMKKTQKRKKRKKGSVIYKF